MKVILSFIWEITKITVLTLAIIIPVRYFLIQPFFVKGASMEPNFEDGQYLVVDEISYRFRLPERGEVIVFRYPADPKQFYIKRIIGLPGETIEISDNRIKIINASHPLGFILEENSYLSSAVLTSGNFSQMLGANEYFVLGDNRAASFDSRRWGVLPKDDLTGRVWLRAWPPQVAKVFAAPEYSY
jgi:signal peptidase I